ncbi:ABC transporter ATP-binding protein [Salinibacterium sp. NG22]|uniref:dipeptide ABC transporter ATP-binding protein n=1 Tax=Salinibacterium sp. NG22 TaxID=2792040 RepID=UPI0018CDC63F|nr:ABC transporter ATP-binding protein [Salinibacterium sp. NG22]MBH0110551.1 ABC transporter ATP-binding protein [Salinibacterium sp. NG22]
MTNTVSKLEDAAPLVDVRQLRIAFGEGEKRVEVVHGIDFHIARGECVAIVGESGSGKTVTARSLIGLTGAGAVVTADEIAVGGRSIMALNNKQWRELRGVEVGLVLQDALVSFDPLRTVGKEISEPLELHKTVPSAEIEEKVIELLRQVGVPEPELRMNQYSHQLSGGLRQRALIASAIAANPALIIADEPTTALDVTVQAQVLELLAARKRENTGILLISHDLAVVSQVADRVYVMRYGEFVEDGPTAEVLNNPQHEYTKALLAADPVEHAKGTRLSIQVGETLVQPRAEISSDVVLSATNLVKSFGDRTVVHGVSFDLHRGETIGIVGESGSGKSTTARMALALDEPDSGNVSLDGCPWSGIPERQRLARRPRMQVIYQDPLSSFDPRYSVSQLLGETLARIDHPRSDRKARKLELLDLVGLTSSMLERQPLQMSGGQRQRVAIARALSMRPEIIVCDEAVSALDVSIQAQVLDLLADLQAEFTMSYLFISHHLGVVRHVSDRVLVMKDGWVVEQGDVDDVFEHPQHQYTQELLAAIPRISSVAEAAAAPQQRRTAS